jgi:hypothetical protein
MSQASDTPAELLDGLHDEEPGLSIRTINARLEQRSKAVRTAPNQALGNSAQNGPIEFLLPATVSLSHAGPLPRLEPLGIEKAEQNSTADADLDQQPCYAPLPGTIYSQSVENAGGSSQRRSPERVCYEKLLREDDPPSGRKPRKTAVVEGRCCSPDE